MAFLMQDFHMHDIPTNNLQVVCFKGSVTGLKSILMMQDVQSY